MLIKRFKTNYEVYKMYPTVFNLMLTFMFLQNTDTLNLYVIMLQIHPNFSRVSASLWWTCAEVKAQTPLSHGLEKTMFDYSVLVAERKHRDISGFLNRCRGPKCQGPFSPHLHRGCKETLNNYKETQRNCEETVNMSSPQRHKRRERETQQIPKRRHKIFLRDTRTTTKTTNYK